MSEPFIWALVLVHVASTWYMTGLIWFVQIVHYPLFGYVDESAFVTYEHQHTARTTLVVGPPMLIEVATTGFLFYFRPIGVPLWQLFIGAFLLAVIWLSTAFVQVPCHKLLSQAFLRSVHQRLVKTNWIRTLAWSSRGVLVGYMLYSLVAEMVRA